MYTKRSLLSLIARQFDPLGFLSPFTISLKILFQQVWKRGLEWDSILPPEFQDEIEMWTAGLKDIGCWEIPRRLKNFGWGETKNKQLQVSVDGSEKAYGACVYLTCSDDHDVQMRLLTSKVSVAPITKVTLPRLELLAALMGARLVKFSRKALELPKDTPYICWTDSKISLAWIQGEPNRWKQFVRNRVEEIQSLTNPSSWRHIPGKENPADLLTRGVKANLLTNSDLWLQGPRGAPSAVQNSAIEEEIDLIEEEISPQVMCSVAVAEIPLIDYGKFSRFERLLRVSSLVLRFIENLKSKVQNSVFRDQGQLKYRHYPPAHTFPVPTVGQELARPIPPGVHVQRLET
ncbi:hypothetical protein EGW08_022298 [Elysia chlorotica]|uniref:Pao retrotransposon peptidase n=1 Tax=Elysia chlorotica TaxID=188477 RepID=A0A3S1B1Z5_ELYCH|nr:hypothetical protein EGW08_022298 [Elysia chlorotica]